MAKAAATVKIKPDVQQVLKNGKWEDGGFQIVGELQRSLYLDFIKVMKAFGGVWNRYAGKIMFADEDAEAAVQEATHSGEYVDLKQLYQFFETPDNIADELVEKLNLNDGKYTVLEPSAGHGAIVKALSRATTDKLLIETTAVEVDPLKVKKLQLLHEAPHSSLKKLVTADFLMTDVPVLGVFDRVVMNPPFASSQDIAHVRHAINFVKPGGILVAIMSPGFMFRSDKKAVEFREWLEARVARHTADYKKLPAGSFKSAGTNVETVVVTIDRP